MHEKFSIAEVSALRRELVNNGLDSLQIAEAIKMFVGSHGYGISGETALEAAEHVETRGYSAERFRNELESSAWAM